MDEPRGQRPRQGRSLTGGVARLLLPVAGGLLLLGGAACGASSDRWTVEGRLLAGDTDVWLVDTTPIAIGRATVTAAQPGLRPDLGAAIRAEGRRQPDGVLAAERITVGPVDRSALASQLPADEVGGAIEALDPATGLWRVAGRTVRVPEGTPDGRGARVGQRVTVRGYALPNGDLLAATVALAAQPVPPPPAPPTRPTPTATPTAPAAPQREPTRQPTKPEPTEKPDKPEKPDDRGPGGGGDDDDD